MRISYVTNRNIDRCWVRFVEDMPRNIARQNNMHCESFRLWPVIGEFDELRQANNVGFFMVTFQLHIEVGYRHLSDF